MRAASAALAVLVVAGACGSGGGKASKGQLTAARGVLLQPSDLPQDWNRVASTAPPGPSQSDRDLARCLGRPDPTTTRQADLHGDAYRRGGVQVGVAVNVMKQVADARADARAVDGGKAESCLNQQFSSSLRVSNTTPAGVQVHVSRFPPRLAGAAGSGFHITAVAARPASQQPQLAVDALYLVAGRLETSVAFIAIGGQIDQAVEQSVVGMVGARLVKAARSS